MKKKQNVSEGTRASLLATELRVTFGQLKRRLLTQTFKGDLTNSQIAVILHLEKQGPQTVTGLAKIEGIRSQSMGTTVSSLESAGLLEGQPDPNDGRRTIYCLTPSCREFIQTGRAARQDWLARAIEAKLLPEEQERLIGALELVKRIVED